ncbi:ABC transporter ATP-binding protein, partial [Vibrio sp. D173a]|uniref:ATP-binding cassette domain-containing protein n=1 Tax=Vibrio sp. D173a TaxID=2836349 RepID=UPI00255323E7
GGQRQRIGIARAIALKPKLLICDESVSALDVSVQAQIINLLLGLQKEMNLAIIFISHDLSVVKQVSDDVAVMYFGKIVEYGSAMELYNNPKNEYTQKLLSAIPITHPNNRKHNKKS